MPNTFWGILPLSRGPKEPDYVFPLDIKHPKFVNLPSLTRRKDGVVCFDPKASTASLR